MLINTIIRLTGDSAFNEAPLWFKYTFLALIISMGIIMHKKFKHD